MIKVKLLLLMFFGFLVYLPAHSQSFNTKETELAERLRALAKNAPQELVYIQTSKDIYETGEDLWFKVYVLDAQYLVPSVISKTLYLQLLNETTAKVCWQEKYEIQDGFANGRVYLESNLPEGDYLLEVFTQNSFFNDSTEFKAVRRIRVKKDITSQTLQTEKPGKQHLIAPINKKANTIQFSTFPEGGDLVSGIQNKLAFKAVNINGEPVDIKGTLFDEATPLLEFKSSHAGMGSFNFVPDAGKKYTIRLSVPAIDSTFFLPEIYPSGMTLRLDGRDKESLSFKVTQSPGLEKENIYLRVQIRGIVYGMTSAKLSREIKIKIPLAGLPQGIAEVTLFKSNLLPVAERLVYINLEQKLNITAELSKEIYPTRGKAILKITTKDETGQPVAANLGITVFDKLYQNSSDSNNILAHCYLSTQLNGRIYNPSFYFNNRNKSRSEALDLLLLTQGWRKYFRNGVNLKKNGIPGQQIIFNGIKGELYYENRKKKIPKEQTFVMAFSPNKDSTNILIPADSAGEFTVSEDLLKAWENDYVYLKPFGSYGSRPIYKITSPEIPEYNLHIRLTDPFEAINLVMKGNEIIYPLTGIKKEKEELLPLALENGVIEIPEVTIRGRKGNTIRGKFMGTLDSLVKFDLYMDYVCLYEVLNCPRHKRDEYGSTKPVPGHFYYQIIAYGTKAEFAVRVQYNPPNFKEDELLKMSNLSRVKAYFGDREFYQPNYDKETEDSIIPDYRNTLLWEPSVITNEKGKATLSFFCSDINSDFIGRIEGVSEDGLLGTGDFKLTVRKLKITP